MAAVGWRNPFTGTRGIYSTRFCANRNRPLFRRTCTCPTGEKLRIRITRFTVACRVPLSRNSEESTRTPTEWAVWWRQTQEPTVWRKLLGLIPLYPAVEIEEVLLGYLDEPELREIAARRLGEYGS